MEPFRIFESQLAHKIIKIPKITPKCFTTPYTISTEMNICLTHRRSGRSEGGAGAVPRARESAPIACYSRQCHRIRIHLTGRLPSGSGARLRRIQSLCRVPRYSSPVPVPYMTIKHCTDTCNKVQYNIKPSVKIRGHRATAKCFLRLGSSILYSWGAFIESD